MAQMFTWIVFKHNGDGDSLFWMKKKQNHCEKPNLLLAAEAKME